MTDLKNERLRDLLWEDARRGFDALIGEVDAAGAAQKKTGWMSQAWHRRLTWLRWLKELRAYCENQHTMALARIVAESKLAGRDPAPEAPQSEILTRALQALQGSRLIVWPWLKDGAITYERWEQACQEIDHAIAELLPLVPK